MDYKKVIIQKIKTNSKADTPVLSKLKLDESFSPFWGEKDKENIKKETFISAIYLYLFWGDEKEKDEIKKVAICKLNKNGDEYKIMCEYILNDECRIDYLLGINDISPSGDFQSYEYVTVEDDIGLYNRANDFIYFRYYHKVNVPGKNRLYEIDDDYRMDASAILGSKAFRRLENKAQIYSSLKGDHYRNRLTHTLDVANIALDIANRVKDTSPNLCKSVEAISFGHDIGHTPFGHVGERTLENIIKGQAHIINNGGKDLYNDVGGFKHNVQSVRILAKLENINKKYKGLNISYEVLEGILKHSKYNVNDVEKMIPKEYCEKLNLYCCENMHLSGKIVDFADEIAQRCADIEDAIRSEKITVDDIIKIISKDVYIDIKDEYEKNLDNDIPITDETGIKICILQKIIKEYFINQLVDYYSKYNLFEYNSDASRLNKMIKRLIDKKVLGSSEVCNFDSKGKLIIEKLFKLYYDNPRLLNDNTIRNIFLDMMDNDICWKKSPIDFRNMSQKFIDKEIEAIHTFTDNDGDEETKHKREELINECGGKECIYEAQKIIVRNICDYIAGMTDEFAQTEYMEKVLALSIN